MKLKIDNSGKGNCMYYAYSISLMYALRKKGERHTAEAIFNTLQLDDTQKRKLHYLLENEKNKPFTLAHITRIIEPILMPATKKLMVEKIKEDFIQKPEETSLCTAASYGFIYFFKLEAAKGSEFASLLADNNFNDKDYTEAEIFRVDGIRAAIKAFIGKNFDSISKEFDDKWAIKVASLPDDKKEDPFYKSNLLEEVISSKVKDFFTDKENHFLNRYMSHLNTSNRWGGEESLFFLHRKILGERVVGSEDAKEIQHDHQINLQIYYNGKPAVMQTESPDMILNNVNNYHWVSLVDPSSSLPLSETEQRNNLLDICGFNAYLQKILEKAEDLEKDYPKASQEAYELHAILTKEKDTFITTPTLLPPNFYETCKKLINESPKMELARHRGIAGYLNSMLKSIQFIVMGIPIALGKYKLIDPLKTDAMHRLNLLENSLAALKGMKTSDKAVEKRDAPPPSFTQQ